jgi:hypothetical protein
VLPIFDGEQEANLIALACSEPPAGCARRTAPLLEKKAVELDIVERASDSPIGRVFKKMNLSRTSKRKMGHPAQLKMQTQSPLPSL